MTDEELNRDCYRILRNVERMIERLMKRGWLPERKVDMGAVRQFPVRPRYPVKRRGEWRKG